MALNLSPIAALRARLLAAREEEAHAILATANERVPVDSGELKASGRVVTDGDTTYITYGLDTDGDGGHAPSNSYVEIIHEDAEMRHPHGGQAFFLRSAADEATAGLAERIAEKARI